MRLGPYRFAPPWWGIAATVLFAALFMVAGVWQIHRGQAKAFMLTQHKAAIKSSASPLLPTLRKIGGSATSALYGKHFMATGRYDSAHQILQDNQLLKGRVGYNVWTPLVLEDGRRLLVNRGWVPMAQAGRHDVPHPQVPDGTVQVRGVLSHFPQPGVRLGDTPDCSTKQWPRVLNYPTPATVRCLYAAPVVDGLLLLDEDQPHGFPRHWTVNVGMPPLRHYAYAAQWFAMALAVVTVFLFVNMKRTQ